MVTQSSVEESFQIYPQLYLFQDAPIKAHASLLEFVLFFVVSALFLTLITYVMQKALDEELKMIEKRYEDESIRFNSKPQ